MRSRSSSAARSGREARRLGGLALALCLAASAGSAQERRAVLRDYSFEKRSASSWKLPKKLREISGLAATPDGRIFAHDDEFAIIYELDPRGGGRLVKAFAFGELTARGDFEGVAVVDGRFFLVTSGGRLYEGSEGRNGERVLYNTYETGVGRKCEVEGLAFEPADRSLLMPCKRSDDPELAGFVAVYRWSLARRGLVEDSPLRIPLASLERRLGEASFHPSGIERHPETGHYILLAAREGAIAEITPAGELVSVRELPPERHPQAEGITFGLERELLLADEGGKRRARLTLYRTREAVSSRKRPRKPDRGPDGRNRRRARANPPLGRIGKRPGPRPGPSGRAES